MKLLLFSDLHANRQVSEAIVQRAADVDVVIGAGDFGNMRRDVRQCIEMLRAIQQPSVLVAGNAESADELREACRSWPSAVVLHGSGITLDGIDFYGVGGGIPTTPFGSWSWDFSEAQAETLLADCPAGAVLITHSPPKGAVDRDSSGRSRGSTAIQDAILRAQPRLVVCGHIHASAGKTETIGSTPIVNAGPDGIDWQLNK
jgi:Icc-related predicted phosphoesterase